MIAALTAPLVFLRRILALAAASVLLCCGTNAAAARKPAPLPSAPPEPVAQSLQVKRGESIDVPLRIYGTRNQTLDFVVKVQPPAGKLSDVKRLQPESSSVRYTPPADLAITREKFTFSVRSNEGVSGAVEVVITILDTPPQLIAPVQVAFAQILSGDVSAQEIEIANRGGGVSEGMVQIDPPWTVKGAPKYRLGAGERKRFEVVFAPKSGGIFSGEARFTSQPDRAISLTGEALDPLAFSPARLELKHGPADPVRSGNFEVTNHTRAPQTFDFAADERLEFPRALTLAAGESARVLVQTAPADVTAFDADIRIVPARAGAALPVHAAAVGPILRIAQPMVNFGTMQATAAAREFVEIENVGGVSAAASMQIAPPFSLPQKSTVIEPGERRKIAVEFQPLEPGAYRAELKLQSVGRALVVPVEGRVPDRRESASPLRVETNSATPKTSAASMPSDSADAESVAAGVADAPALQVTEMTPTSAATAWPEIVSGAVRYGAEVRQLSLAGGALKIDWLPFPGFSFERKDGRATGHFSGLRPHTFYAMRVLGFDAEGQSTGPPYQAGFTTPAKPPIVEITAVRTLGVLLVLCLAGAVWQRIRSRRIVG